MCRRRGIAPLSVFCGIVFIALIDVSVGPRAYDTTGYMGGHIDQESARPRDKRSESAKPPRKRGSEGDVVTKAIGALSPLGEIKDESSVLTQAVRVIGDRAEAMRWMGTPVRELNYATPVSLLGTSEGRKAVTTVLGRLEHGVL